MARLPDITALPPMEGLQRFRRFNRYSQNGEDGIIEELCCRLGIATGWFCEFGAWDGRYGSNCYALLRDGWKGVMIEADPDRCVTLRELAHKSQNLIAMEAFVSADAGSPNSLDNLLARTPIPCEFELLSIDIDGSDYHVWAGVARYRPIIVVIEIESSVPPGPEYVAEGGSTFSAMVKLGLEKGYRAVAHTGNLVFVREDYVPLVGLSEQALAHPETLFVNDWVDPTPLRVLARKLRHLTPERAWVKLDNWQRDRRHRIAAWLDPYRPRLPPPARVERERTHQ